LSTDHALLCWGDIFFFFRFFASEVENKGKQEGKQQKINETFRVLFSSALVGPQQKRRKEGGKKKTKITWQQSLHPWLNIFNPRYSVRRSEV